LDTIQEKVKVEAQAIDSKTKELLDDWANKKPIGVCRIHSHIYSQDLNYIRLGRS